MKGLILGGVIPAILFGLTGFLQKVCARMGIGAAFYLISIGVGVIMAGLMFLAFSERTFSVLSGATAVAIGFFWSLGTVLVIVAIMKYNTPLSKLVPLYNMNTLVAVLLAILLFSEWKEVNSRKLLLGALLMILGGTLVASS